MQMPQATQILKKFSFNTGNKKIVVLIGALVVILAGIGTGVLMSRKAGGVAGLSTGTSTVKIINTTNEAGIDDPAFKDTAQGIMRAGGIKGEGSFHLERPGGTSQNVYLVSTAVDLSLFVGKKVQVWGQTQAGQHAGWFMDVGHVKVLE